MWQIIGASIWLVAVVFSVSGCPRAPGQLGNNDYIVYLPNDYYIARSNQNDTRLRGPVYEFADSTDIETGDLRVAINKDYVIGSARTSSDVLHFFILDTTTGEHWRGSKGDWEAKLSQESIVETTVPALEHPRELYLREPSAHLARHQAALHKRSDIVTAHEKSIIRRDDHSLGGEARDRRFD